MATSWKSQIGDGKYALQFETDDVEKYKLVEKSAQMAVDGKTTADVVEVVRCKDCIYYESYCCFNRQWDLESSSEIPMVRENDYCSYGERK